MEYKGTESTKVKILRRSMTLSLSLQQAEADLKAKNSELVQACEMYKSGVANLKAEKEQLRRLGLEVDVDQDKPEIQTKGREADKNEAPNAQLNENCSDAYRHRQRLEAENEWLKAQLYEQRERTEDAVNNVLHQNQFVQKVLRERDSVVNELNTVRKDFGMESKSHGLHVNRKQKDIEELQCKLRNTQEVLTKLEEEKKTLHQRNWQQSVEIENLRKAVNHLQTQNETLHSSIKNNNIAQAEKKKEEKSKTDALLNELQCLKEMFRDELQEKKMLQDSVDQLAMELTKSRKVNTELETQLNEKQKDILNRIAEFSKAKAELESWEYQEVLRRSSPRNRRDSLESEMEYFQHPCWFC